MNELAMTKADGRHEEFYSLIVEAGLRLKLSEPEMVAIVGRAIGYNHGAAGADLYPLGLLAHTLVSNISAAKAAFLAGEVTERAVQ